MLEPTPTLDSSLPRRYADFDTLLDALDYAAQGKRGLNFYSPRGELETSLTYKQIRDRAFEIGKRLVHFGIKRHSRVALIAETNEDFVCYFLGCQYAGLLPVPLPLPTSFGGRDGYTEQLHQQMKSCEASAAISASYMLPLLDEATNGLEMEFVGTPVTFEAQARLSDLENVQLPNVKTDDLAYLQYSSGSTRFPHGVAVTHKSLMSNCHGIGKYGMEVQDDDRAVSWLPFYHDMGLVGMLISPIACQVSIDYLATEAFARRPMQWLKLISKNKGTMCSGPTFGYEICARRANKTDLEGLDLSSWRVAGIGADMIRPPVLETFAETFKDCGFNKNAFMPSYGLAECTLAVSFGPKLSGYDIDLVSEDVLSGEVKTVKEHKANGNGANYREVVDCGKPLPEYELEIRDENDNALGDREIGRVCVKGQSVMVGYYMDEEATKACLSDDGWLDTGDIGYVVDGSLFIIGRIKDLIIINGKNHWPHDIEWAVEKLPELRSGDSAAISIPGENEEEVPAILVQCRKRDEDEREDLENRIKTEVQAVIGKSPVVVLVPPRSLPRTSSGKLSRVKARRQYLAGQLA
ncbi:fatty acyl-AMP ligase [Pseudemcibacter aquimaris]|uniref:fatty acyl-AMP ligase n=1 Tax=Pseudemcibacter aquimaris TaxID=2857064 RepID=UPI00201320F2|nr:fatty acyl-AMP ligase [Pseudemcibacter aquimaris]MCC3860643.1 fatty acyl-AMP ligase [Pseudemcibacter aquimaris]WDU59462.1 fatty acyl-AMP ligase [Pseudemcibacter aquimaris]